MSALRPSPAPSAPPSDPAAWVGRVLGDKYRITEVLDEGGMARVYAARHLRLGSHVAVKVIAAHLSESSVARSRFHDEAAVVAQLAHPHIVQVIDFDVTEQGQAYLVMELLDGESLAARLERRGKLPAAEAVPIALQVASALSAAHSRGVVHRDLKPENVFVMEVEGEPPFVKLLDFGISKVASRRRKLTLVNEVIGTPHYMAPEQATASSEAIDHRADQYSLAVLTYELVTGRRPFEAETIPELLRAVVSEPAPPAWRLEPAVSRALSAVLERALSKAPIERYDSITDFARRLEAAVPELAAQRAPASAPPIALTRPKPASRAPPPSRTPPPVHTERPTPGAGRYSSPRRVATERVQLSSARHDPATLARAPAHAGRAPTSPAQSRPAPARRPRSDPWRAQHLAANVAQLERGIQRACRLHASGKLSSAALHARDALALGRGGSVPGAASIIARSEGMLARIFLDYLGGEDRLLAPCRAPDKAGVTLSPPAVYLLSRLEGGLSVGDALDLAPMPRLEALERLAELLAAGVVRGVEPSAMAGRVG